MPTRWRSPAPMRRADRRCAWCCSRSLLHWAMPCSTRTTAHAKESSSRPPAKQRQCCIGTSSDGRSASRAWSCARRLPRATAISRADPRLSQVNAWSSEQSRPLADPAALEQRAARVGGTKTSATLPRPEFWGGFRLWLDAVELWVEGQNRFHERVRYERAPRRSRCPQFRGGPLELAAPTTLTRSRAAA